MDMKAAIQIVANVKGQQEIERLRGSMGALDGTVGKLKAALGALGIAFTAQQFGMWIKGAIDAGDALNDMRQRTGIAVEELDALSLAAEQNGTTLEAMAGNLSRLGRTMGDAIGGSKTAAANLKQFGIGLNEIKTGSISTTEALARIADRVQQMPDGLQKAAAVQKIFGKGAAELIPLLNAGGDAIRDAGKTLDEYGARMTGEFASAADEFNDKLALLARLSRAAGAEIAGELIGPVDDLLTMFLEYVKKQGGVVGAVQAIKIEFADLANVIGLVGDNLDRLSEWSQWLDKLATTYGPFSQNAQQGFFGTFEAPRKPLEINIDGSGVPVGPPIPPKPKLRPTLGSTGGFDFGSGDAAEEAARAAKKRTDDLKRQTQAINDYVLSQQESIDLLRLESERVNMSAFEYQQLVDAKKQEYDVARATNDMLPETAARYQQVAAAMFSTRQEVEKLNYEQSRTFEFGAKNALEEYAQNAGNAAEQIGGVIDDAFSGMEDALVEFVRTGKLDFSSLVDSMIADLARLAIRQAILGPLAQALGGAISLTPNANGGVMTSNGPMPLRTYAAGGIATSPQLALYGEGSMNEAIVPLPDGRSIPVRMQGNNGGNVQVIVNNNSGQNVSTNETRDGRGNRRIEVQVGDLVASEISRSGSSANMAIRNSFRATPALTGR